MLKYFCDNGMIFHSNLYRRSHLIIFSKRTMIDVSTGINFNDSYFENKFLYLSIWIYNIDYSTLSLIKSHIRENNVINFNGVNS